MVWIEGGAATQAGAKSVRRAPDLEGAAGLSASVAGGGAGTTSGSGVVVGGSVLVLSAGIVASPRTAEGVGGLAGSTARRGGVGGPAPRGAATAAPGEAGIVLSPPVGAAGGAASRTVGTPRAG